LEKDISFVLLLLHDFEELGDHEVRGRDLVGSVASKPEV
jgi:hypothetical protein